MSPAAVPDTAAARPSIQSTAGPRRLRDRFLRAGREAVDDRDLLELLLSARSSAGDAEALAASLLDMFGSAPRVLAARPDRLRTVPGLPEDAIAALKAAEALGIRMARAEVPNTVRPALGSYDKVIEYCRAPCGSPRSRGVPHLVSQLMCSRYLCEVNAFKAAFYREHGASFFT